MAKKPDQLSEEFKRFDDGMGKLLQVSHEELQKQLRAEREAKKRKPKTSASGRDDRAKD